MLRRFYLQRHTDVSGISGVGVVAYGVQHVDSGRVAIFWGVPDKPNSITIWDSLADAKRIHSHDGATDFVWLDGLAYGKKVQDAAA
jgi:hypothetical protein